MPILSNIDNENQLTTFTVLGEASFDEMMVIMKDFWEGKPTKYELWDSTNGTFLHLHANKLEEITDYVMIHAKKRSNGKTAFVVRSKTECQIIKGLGMVKKYANAPFTIKAFITLDEAYCWFKKE